MLPRKDHGLDDVQVRAVRNDIAHQNPLVLICGDRAGAAPAAMPHRYCVLGWYKPVAVWAEKTLGKAGRAWTTVKYRFERLGAAAGEAWHAPDGDAGAVVTADERRLAMDHANTASCCRCGLEFEQIYLVSWMCLNPACEQFWKTSSGEDADYGELDYHPAFLLNRRAWADEREPYGVKPGVPDVGKAIGDNLTRINTRGICCPDCGRCNSRRLFWQWKCDNKGCEFSERPLHRPVTPRMLHNPWDMMGEGPSLAQNKFETGVKVTVGYSKGFKVYRYTFNGIDGSLVHAVSNTSINAKPHGPDAMFEAMQKQGEGDGELQLVRRRFGKQQVADGKVEDGDLMTAFSMNYGMPYKFVASGASASFEGAPWPVRACRSTLNGASQAFLEADAHVEFNEELIFAYMEGQKIEYHDDGEKGLGPRIATLSLGGAAKMHMRMKRKHYVGCSLQGILTAERPKPGGIDGHQMDQKRLAAWEELQRVGAAGGERSLYERRRKELATELGLVDKRSKLAPDLVTLTLHHGDIVLMEGYEIQQYLEHKVVSESYLRFAMTCRTVLEDHLLPEERPEYEVLPDDGELSFL